MGAGSVITATGSPGIFTCRGKRDIVRTPGKVLSISSKQRRALRRNPPDPRRVCNVPQPRAAALLFLCSAAGVPRAPRSPNAHKYSTGRGESQDWAEKREHAKIPGEPGISCEILQQSQRRNRPKECAWNFTGAKLQTGLLRRLSGPYSWGGSVNISFMDAARPASP